METSTQLSQVNNGIYSELGRRWYEAKDDPVALLRAESRLRNPWVADQLTARFGARACAVLDVGCGAGFLANAMAVRGHHVIGLDAAEDALGVGRSFDVTGRVEYRRGDALALPFDDGSFDAVCAMDFLEHVEAPAQAIAEAARVLKPGGLFFFHTFNRNWLAWLVVIKGVEWFVRNTPRDLHVLRLFLKPSEVRSMCANAGLETLEVHGSRPRLGRAFWRMLSRGEVADDFEFVFTSSLLTGFTGVARKHVALQTTSASIT